MDLIQSRHFLSLAQTLNFTRATEVCNGRWCTLII